MASVLSPREGTAHRRLSGGLGRPRGAYPLPVGTEERAMAVSESQLKKMMSKYKYRDLTVRQTVNVIAMYKDLKPVLDSYVFNDGSSRELVNLTGTIPVRYRAY